MTEKVITSLLLLTILAFTINVVASQDTEPEGTDADYADSPEAPKTESPGESKPKSSFSDDRFAKLFNNRNKKPRLPPPKAIYKAKPTLPSFIKKPPSLMPVTFSAVPSTTSRPTTAAVERVAVRTTKPPRSRSRSRSQSTTESTPVETSTKRRYSNSSKRTYG